MKSWRKWITCLLILTLPQTGNAGLLLHPHCNHDATAVISTPDQELSGHCANKEKSQKTIEQDSNTGQCECNDHVACVSAGISSVAISNLPINYRDNRNHLVAHLIIRPLISIEQHKIYRPPIYIS